MRVLVMTLKDRILLAVKRAPGQTDRELANQLLGATAQQAPVNQATRHLASKGELARVPREDGKIGNYPAHKAPKPFPTRCGMSNTINGMTEDQVKSAVEKWLETEGWCVQVRWGHEHGIDIEASCRSKRWVIEAKGCGSRPQMRVNYFINVLGETLQRMDDPKARYSIALPDMPQYRTLWARLPSLAKSRTKISLILVDSCRITHLV
jgi:hypothetical protein